MRVYRIFAMLCLAGFVIVTSIFAHDTWLVPSSFRCAPGDTITVDIATGMEFPASESAVDENRVNLFEAFHEKHRAKPVSYTVANDALRATMEIPAGDSAIGTWTVVNSLKPRLIELGAEDFNEYLLHDGLKRIHEFREQKGLLNKDAVERYTKHAKTLVQIGDQPDDTPTRPYGQTIEIVPSVNPYSLKRGDKLALTVFYQGKPLAGAEIAWSYVGHGEGHAGSSTCDEKGQTIVPLARAGAFLIRTIHMERVQQPEYEWESHWASLTFEVAGR